MVVIISYSSNTSAPYMVVFVIVMAFFSSRWIACMGLCSREALKVCVIKNCARKNKFKTV